MRNTREPGSSELVERDHEAAVLSDLLDRARSGNGGVVVLEGPAGIGKSRLSAYATHAAVRNGMTVLRAHGGELERQLTYGVIRQLFERTLAASDPAARAALLGGSAHLALLAIGDTLGEGAVSLAPAEMSIAHGLYWLVSNLAADGPVAMLVDDAHWADAASLRALVYLARRIEGLPVALVVAARTEEPGGESEFIGMLGDERLSQRLPLAPLSVAGCSRLLATLVVRPLPSEAAEASRNVSGGNPFFVGELGEVLSTLSADSDPIEAILSTAPSAVIRAVAGRIRKVGQDAVAVSETLSVAGDDPPLDLLCTASGLPQTAVTSALRELEAAGIVTSNAGLGFRHPILRTAVYQDMSRGRRSLQHAAVANALLESGAALEDVANHLLLTKPAGDPATVRTLREVARRSSMRNAPSDAVSLLERAAAEPPQRAQRTAVLAELGEAQLLAGDPAAAVMNLRVAVADLSTEQLKSAAIALSTALLSTEGPSAAVSALEQINVNGDREAALRLDIERASIARFVPELMPQAQALVDSFAGLPGDSPNERLALAHASVAHIATGTATTVRRTARRVLGDGTFVAERTFDGPHFGMAMTSLLFCEDLDVADRELDRAFAEAGARGSAFGFDTASIGALIAAVCRGDLVSATAHGEALLSGQRDSGSIFDAFRIAMPRRWLVEAFIERGELEQARSILDGGLAFGGDLATLEWNPLGYARGLYSLAVGENSAALEDFIGHGNSCAAVGYEDRLSPWRRQAALASLALGRQADAIEFADQALDVAIAWGTPGAIGESLRVRALVGPNGEAIPRLGEAVNTLEASHFRLAHARALIDYGAALRRAGQRTAAQTTLATGLDLAARLEVKPLIDRAQQELRVIGARPQRLRISGLEGLTAAERRIASMAAEGLTNREIAQSLFVTLKTVEGHLAAVFRKLDIRSRKALPARLSQTG